MRPRRLTLALGNGHLAVLSRPFMARYFKYRLSLWYPGTTLTGLAIKDNSSTAFKKSVAYTLGLRAANGEKTLRIIRGNVPSADTTLEARAACGAMVAIWKTKNEELRGPITRPLGFDERLRVLFYESVPGTPLTELIRRKNPNTHSCVRRAAAWLAELHRAALPVGTRRSLRNERKDVWYFGMNYRQYYPVCDAETRRLFAEYFRRRIALDAQIRHGSMLLHGDYNPNNILLDIPNDALHIIDFGNAWRYDPMSDYANAIVQIELLGWQLRLHPSYVSALTGTFAGAYEKNNPLRGSMRHRKNLFLAWWSFQTLSYVLTLDFVLNKTPMIRRSLARARKALA